jgi:acyl-coenzyme A thioesterase PaaI-like protein
MTASREEIIEFLGREFPKGRCRVEQVGGGSATVSHDIGPDDLRPGETVFGPILMTVADVGLYVAILGEIGIVPLAVTTNLTINFMRRPSAHQRIIGRCKLLKVGKRQAVGEVLLYSEGDPQAVAHAIGTYSIPPTR